MHEIATSAAFGVKTRRGRTQPRRLEQTNRRGASGFASEVYLGFENIAGRTSRYEDRAALVAMDHVRKTVTTGHHRCDFEPCRDEISLLHRAKPQGKGCAGWPR